MHTYMPLGAIMHQVAIFYIVAIFRNISGNAFLTFTKL
jgi:hypothetical protein